MSELSEYSGDDYWRAGDVDWWDPAQLPESDRPTISYIPRNFEGPSLARDGIDLRSFNKGQVARVAPNPNRRPNTPDGGRERKSGRLANEEAVVEASPYGKNDHFTNDRRIASEKCHTMGYGTSANAGLVIDHCKGNKPGTWFPCGRNNNFYASSCTHTEETKKEWLLFNLCSVRNLNFPEGIFELVNHNLDASPKDQVKFTDYFPHLERTVDANRGYPCLAVCLRSGSDFRVFHIDGKTQINPGQAKPKDNGIIFLSHLDPYEMTARTAQVIRYWDWIGVWPRRDTPFNRMIQGLIIAVRRGTPRWFMQGAGQTLAYWKASMANKNPARYIQPVTGLIDSVKPTTSLPSPSRRPSPLSTRPRPGLLDCYYYPTWPDRISREEESKKVYRSNKRDAIQNAPPSPPAYNPFDDDDDNGAAPPTDTATTPAASDFEEDEDRTDAGRSGLGSGEFDEFDESDEEAEVEAMVAVPSSDSDSTPDDNGSAASMHASTTPAVADPDDGEGERAEVEAEHREEDKEDDAPVPPTKARTVRTQPAEPSDEEDEVEKAPPVRRSSRIPVRREKSGASLVETEPEGDFNEKTKPVRNPRTRSATQRKGTATATASNDEKAPRGRRVRTHAAAKATTAAVTNEVSANVNEATTLGRTRSITRSIAKGKAPAAAQQSNATAGPGPATAAMRGRKRVVSTSEAQKEELPKQKKKRAASRR
ncbi:hypothetical protein CYLTODRAFT_495121 [Cylindrobasidium torrendii FP15055 ss-10]|uniref:Uncharacterized protein n=1 Tax=Cylindrobasidium torrendii FP15055 ss-10 TaxID=1314674 RepID=A0A0D7AWP4_9AGAR|nr:hypothetical protein CYLTODRAFT_495121 [Cylindrobasidium torrendii FP15055 ss-10]